MDENGGMASQFTVVDSAVFGLMLAATVGIGVYTSLRGSGRSTKEYLLGGRTMPPLPVALSLMGGALSAISILGPSSEVYYFGTQITIIILGSIPGMILVCLVTLPLFYKLELVSLNEYLELRYRSRTLRQLSMCMQLLYKSLYMGMCLYAPSLALTTITNISTLTSMLVMGGVCTFYITIGGVKAVIYADVLHTSLMFGGVVAVVIICCIDLGGVSNVWTIADEGHRLQFFNLDTSPYIRHTFWSTFTLGTFNMLDYIGICQEAFQRFSSVSTLRVSQRLGWCFLVGLSCLWSMNFFAGLVAYATYSRCDPLTSGRIHKPDQIFPYLVTDKLSHLPGLMGLFVTALCGAVLSSLSSLGNSSACLVWEDFLKHRPYFSRLNDRQATNVVKLLSALSGVVAVGAGLLVGSLGNIFHVAHSVLGVVKGPIVGIYLAGIFFPWTNAKGAIVGFFMSFVFTCWLVVGKFIMGGGDPIKLPLSVHGCTNTTVSALTILDATTVTATSILNTISNTTTNPSDTTIYNDTTQATTFFPDHLSSTSLPLEEPTPTVYDLSYCYLGIVGTLITMAVAAVVSLATGPTPPEEVSGDLVVPSCGRLYLRVWQLTSGTRKSGQEAGEGQELERAISITRSVSSLNTSL